MRTALALWILMGLFFLRVLGQILVEFFQVSFLPPSEEWFSGLMPYRQLLTSQFVILALMTKIGRDFTRKVGWSYQPRVYVGGFLLLFGSVYLTVMILRYLIRMSLYPLERWTGGCIPIFFHWILAAYVLILAAHHWRTQIRSDRPVSQRKRRWTRVGQFAGLLLVIAGIGVWTMHQLLPSFIAYRLGIRPSQFAVRVDSSVHLTTSDGMSLAANVYHPRRAGMKTPTILVRIPYSKTWVNSFFASVTGQMWAERGYTVVIQGTRGRYESTGQYDPMRYERDDGIATLRWIAEQPWYNGRIGMWGCSYFGYTQWVLADQHAPGPTALLIGEASTDFEGMFHPGGAFSLKSALYWALMSHGERDVIPEEAELARGLAGFSLLDADDRAVKDIGFFNDWASHTTHDEYWQRIDGEGRAARSRAPVLLLAGWYDPFLPTQLQDFIRLKRDADPRVASPSRLMIGPWSHAETVVFPDGTVSRNFRLESLAPSVSWFDQHLRDEKSVPQSPVRIYVMGRHQWRDEKEWPLARTVYTPYYLHSAGDANRSPGGGTLSLMPPGDEEPADQFLYDPHKPVPTRGGPMIGYSARGGQYNAGIERQNDIESRDDVLVYTTEPLPEDVEVTGPVQLALFVGTTAPSTDFTGKLVDVWPDGSAFNVSDGILRRDFSAPASDRTEIIVELWPTSMVFLKGHRLRLEVSSSNYPRFDRNPNTGEAFATEKKPSLAHQSVLHSAAAPSRLILPIIPTALSTSRSNE